MENQYWGSIHVLPDQTQAGETDRQMREFLSSLHFKSPKTFLDDVGKWYNGLTSQHSMMFVNVGYVDKYTNLPKTKDFHASIYGISGIHNIARVSRYVNYYISEEQTLLGADFFPYVFGSFYFSEEEARDTSEKVTALLEQKTALKKKNYNVERKENDRELVCRIVERLWSSQMENVATRLVLCFGNQEVESRSLELIKQIYLLLPQRLRMNMGFCTNSNIEDIRYLTEKCELPVHIFTMSVNDMEKEREAFEKANFKYPVVLFNVKNPKGEPCDPERLALIRKLSQTISPSSDAKIAYAEKMVLKEERGAQVSFKNLQKIFEKMNDKNFCWWERKDLERIEDIYQLYQEQNEMMNVEILHDEAVDTFYRRLLPWKEYAKQLASVVIDETYRNREEILKFFANELEYAKVLESLEYVKKTISEKDVEHENQVLALAEEKRKAEEDQHLKQLDQLKQDHSIRLEEKEKSIQKLKKQNREQKEQFEKEKHQQTESFRKQLDAERDAHARELKQKDADCDSKIDIATADKQNKINELERSLEGMRNTNTSREIERLSREKENADNKVKELKSISSEYKKGKKKYMLLFSGAAPVAVISLAAAIFFGIKTKEIHVLESEKAAVESQLSILESENQFISEENQNLKSESTDREKRERELESELESLKNTVESETETESETPQTEFTGEMSESGNRETGDGVISEDGL